MIGLSFRRQPVLRTQTFCNGAFLYSYFHKFRHICMTYSMKSKRKAILAVLLPCSAFTLRYGSSGYCSNKLALASLWLEPVETRAYIFCKYCRCVREISRYDWFQCNKNAFKNVLQTPVLRWKKTRSFGKLRISIIKKKKIDKYCNRTVMP